MKKKKKTTNKINENVYAVINYEIEATLITRIRTKSKWIYSVCRLFACQFSMELSTVLVYQNVHKEIFRYFPSCLFTLFSFSCDWHPKNAYASIPNREKKQNNKWNLKRNIMHYRCHCLFKVPCTRMKCECSGMQWVMAMTEHQNETAK